MERIRRPGIWLLSLALILACSSIPVQASVGSTCTAHGGRGSSAPLAAEGDAMDRGETGQAAPARVRLRDSGGEGPPMLMLGDGNGYGWGGIAGPLAVRCRTLVPEAPPDLAGLLATLTLPRLAALPRGEVAGVPAPDPVHASDPQAFLRAVLPFLCGGSDA